jgi:uncharacterized protein YkwD
MRVRGAALACLAVAGAANSVPPPDAADVAAVSRRVVEETNAFRRSHGLAEVHVEPHLKRAADEFAAYMARSGKYGHEADGREPATRAQAAGYDYCLVLENIAYHFDSRGFRTAVLAERIEEGWEKSPPHRKNLSNPLVTHVAVATARGANGYYYSVQMLGLPRSASVKFEVRNESDETIRYRVGDSAYAIPARSIRTHEVCNRDPLRFEHVAGGEGVVPKSHDRFLIEREAGRLVVRRR